MTFYWREGGEFIKHVVVTFSVPKSIYEWPLTWMLSSQKFSITVKVESILDDLRRFVSFCSKIPFYAGVNQFVLISEIFQLETVLTNKFLKI